jgi:hypothetical protein
MSAHLFARGIGEVLPSGRGSNIRALSAQRAASRRTSGYGSWRWRVHRKRSVNELAAALSDPGYVDAVLASDVNAIDE